MTLVQRVAIALPLALLAACGPNPVGYVDVQRALNECADGKRVISELEAAKAARQAARAAGPLAQSDEEWNAHQQARRAEAVKPIAARMAIIVPAVLRFKKLSALAPTQSMAFVPPELDVTDELIRRYDAGEGRDDKAAELAAARAKVAALERELKPKDPKEK